MNSLSVRVSALVNKIDPEYRIPVMNALQTCDGSFLSFHSELECQKWDYPELPVEHLIEEICWDVA